MVASNHCEHYFGGCQPAQDQLAASRADAARAAVGVFSSFGVESAFVKLSTFEKIAHEYLIDMRQHTASSRNLPESDWLKIMDALDKNGIEVEAELTDSPRQVLEAVRRRGHQITTWRECYQFRSRVSMDDGKNHSLRREVTHAIHNAAKRAAYQLAKVWSVKG